MRTNRYKVVLVTLILVSTIVISHLYIRSSQYIQNGMFLYTDEITHSKIIGSAQPSMNRTDKSPTLVLVGILAYMHTGSSYAGSIFQNHPGTFYFYEPLRSLQDSSRRNASIQYLNGTKRQLSGDWIPEDVAMKAVDSLLHCEHNQLDFDTLVKGYYSKSYKRGRDQIPYFNCVKNDKVTSIRTIRKCLPLLTGPCLRANHRAFKFIRLSMKPVLELLRRNLKLKFIYLVRDPRAMLDSQVRKNNMGSRNLNNFLVNSERMCTKMHEDFRIYNSFPPYIRERIKLVRYEDLTDSPSTVVPKFFNFTNVEMLEKDRKFVAQSTRKGDNSTRYKLDKWRTHISQMHVNILNRKCSAVYDDFGYLEYKDISDIRNFDKPSYTKYE